MSGAEGPDLRPSTFVGLDAGTTNTRAWLVDGERILARRAIMEARAG